MQTFKIQRLTVTATAVAAVLLMIGQGTAQAAEVTYAGSTSGLFSVTSSQVYQNLTFVGNNIGGTTVAGQDAVNFGTFVFTTSTAGQSYTGNFTLSILFTSPVTIAGGQTVSNTATVSGTVSVNGGAVDITFPNTISNPANYTFTNPTKFGEFSIGLNTVSIGPPSLEGSTTLNLSGKILRASSFPVPEASTMVGMGSMLAGGGFTLFGGVIRRRRKGGQLAA